jgi:hypothetical protein
MGERVLFKTVRQAPAETLLVASGTSCRQQIAHGTGRRALHLAEALALALPRETAAAPDARPRCASRCTSRRARGAPSSSAVPTGRFTWP